MQKDEFTPNLSWALRAHLQHRRTTWRQHFYNQVSSFWWATCRRRWMHTFSLLNLCSHCNVWTAKPAKTQHNAYFPWSTLYISNYGANRILQRFSRFSPTNVHVLANFHAISAKKSFFKSQSLQVWTEFVGLRKYWINTQLFYSYACYGLLILGLKFNSLVLISTDF